MDQERLNEKEKSVRFFDKVYESIILAGQSEGGFIDQYLSIGGYTINLRFVGPALIPYLIPALKHLTAETQTESALTIYLLDSASTGRKIPPPPWSHEDYLAQGTINGYNNGRIHTSYNLVTSMLSMLDSERDLGLLWIKDARQILYTDSAAPFRSIFHWWMRDHNRQLLHAASVGDLTGSVLIPGRSGSGKSTTALACMFAGFFYLGDDHVLVDEAPKPQIYSLYNSAKVHEENLKDFPHLLPMVSNNKKLDCEKALIFMYEHHPERITTCLPIRLIIIPKITGLTSTKIYPVSPGKALKALAPSTIFQMSGAGLKDFQTIANFVRKVPCYTIEMGTTLSEIPKVIALLLSVN